jgi:RNA polymerase sigma factor (sigma-70 family)
MAIASQESVRTVLEHTLADAEPRLRWVFQRLGIPHQDREDLLQETLLQFVQKRDSIREPQAWLPAALRRQCLMYWRRRRRRLYSTVDETLLDLMTEDTQTPQEQDDLRRDLTAAVARLPLRCRRTLKLRYALGYDPGETADRLGYRRSGIYKIVERCLAALTGVLVQPKPRDEVSHA